MKRQIRVLRLGVVVVAIGLVVVGAVLVALASTRSGAKCTFDNFSCKSNALLADAARCFFGALVLGVIWAVTRPRRRLDRD